MTVLSRSLAVPLAVLVPALVVSVRPPQVAEPAVPELTVAALAADPEPDPLVDRVKKAIDGGVAWLKREQRGGHWDTDVELRSSRAGGYTSLVLLALLNAGVPPDDPAVKAGLAYLRTLPPTQTYVVGLQTMVFALVGDPADRDRIQRNVEWLERTRLADGWTYHEGARGVGVADNSNTQYALLGLHDARRAGARVDSKGLEAVRAFYLATQTDGGWPYKKADPQVTMTMTTAGLSALLITGLDLDLGKQKLRPDGSADNCGVYEGQKPVADALAWIGDRFPDRLTEDEAAKWGSVFYALYGIERVGRLTGQRFLGGHDWYRVGCQYLVVSQRKDGSWFGSGAGGARQFDGQPTVATSFALLFLSKGRTPVLVTKLAYGPGEGWNNKHGDCRNVVEFVSRELFKNQPLAWQTFDVRNQEGGGGDERIRALAAELLPSPVVWFNGHGFAPRDREEKVLQEYLNNGGFVFAEACCGSKAFDTDFRALVKRLFRDSGAELVELPPDHPVWTASGKFISSPRDFKLYGVELGCKTVLVYSPQPISGYWEANDLADPRGRKAFELAANVIAYATGLDAPRPRLTEVKVPEPSKTTETVRSGYFEVAVLAHDGDWHWPSKALPNLLQDLRSSGLDVALRPALVQLSPGIDVRNRPDAVMPGASAPTPDIGDINFFYLHGRRSFTWDKATLEKLRFRLENGGTLLADAACGSRAFRDAFPKFIDALFDGKRKLEPIPLEERPGKAEFLFSEALNGTAITTVMCRREEPGRRGPPELRQVAPELLGVKIDGRWAVIYSPYDIGCALEKHAGGGCLGHDHDSAVRLARAAILYSLRR